MPSNHNEHPPFQVPTDGHHDEGRSTNLTLGLLNIKQCNGPQSPINPNFKLDSDSNNCLQFQVPTNGPHNLGRQTMISTMGLLNIVQCSGMDPINRLNFKSYLEKLKKLPDNIVEVEIRNKDPDTKNEGNCSDNWM